MESEKVKEIKKALEYAIDMGLVIGKNTMFVNIKLVDILTLINKLERENERLSKEKEDLRLFDIALGNGKVDMTLGGNNAKNFINAIVQIFEQNKAMNFLATTIEAVSSGNKYSLVIQKENGQTPSEKLTELKDRIAELENENKILRKHNIGYHVANNYEAQEQLKEFAERLKEKVKNFCGTEYENAYYDVTKSFACNDIDETLKEYTNENGKV